MTDTVRKVTVGRVIREVFEYATYAVLLEVLWYSVHDEHLHEAILEKLEELRDRFHHYAVVQQTLRMIRSLPEE